MAPLSSAQAAAKDAALRALDEHEPIIPLAAVRQLLSRAGAQATDDAVLKLVALDAERLAAAVLRDALSKHSAHKTGLVVNKRPTNSNKRIKTASEGTVVDESLLSLQAADIKLALTDTGFHAIRAPYFVLKDSS